jgi:CHAD domain-containing protein
LVQLREPDAAVDAPNSFDGTVLRNYAAAELDRALAYLAWRGGRLHDGVHQARKSLRRVRSVLALGMPALGPGAELLGREIGRLNRRLSKLRDAQALVEVLDRLIGKTEEAELAPVLRRARRLAAKDRAERARKVVADDPNLARRRALLMTLRAAFPSLAWSAPTEADVRDAWAHSRLRVEEAGARALASGEDSDWHRWRRRVRRISQQHLALGDMLPDLTQTRRHYKSLAGSLGEAQDYALLREHCGKRSRFSDPDRRNLRELADRGTERMRARVAESAVVQPSAATQTP